VLAALDRAWPLVGLTLTLSVVPGAPLASLTSPHMLRILNHVGRSNMLHKTYAPDRFCGSSGPAPNPRQEQSGGFCINSAVCRCINSQTERR
jgi:hypothetical protein